MGAALRRVLARCKMAPSVAVRRDGADGDADAFFLSLRFGDWG